tara:strand:+ start:2217 stop:2744 length:528 start_codon:yes stop_codon:yes gene_type:complete
MDLEEEEKLWKEEAGEFICLKEGLKYLKNAKFRTSAAYQNKGEKSDLIVFYFKRSGINFLKNMEEAFKKFNQANELNTDLIKKRVGVEQSYRAESLETFLRTFKEDLDEILAIIEKIKDGHLRSSSPKYLIQRHWRLVTEFMGDYINIEMYGELVTQAERLVSDFAIFLEKTKTK